MIDLVTQAGLWALRNTEKQKGEKVGYTFIFVDTHATKATKKRLRDGEITIDDLDKLEFVTEKSKKAYISLTKELERVYGSDKDHNLDRDELVVWEGLNPNSRFGIGSSDPRFVVTGTLSSFCGSTSYTDSLQLHEVQRVQSELEKEQQARQNLENRLQQMEQERL
ncbi:hypothetical protein E3N88_16239 [Mikania micrantha]|uniref:Uncharacterized protein n=1 Tax=Mikania micrantha TaxID=192012 RepID=A0A5N6NXX6_9ASTR|nr:hypothetical protein E3N88_16239 [Mikania micrantha]